MRELTVYYAYVGENCYPLIRLQGRWLEILGFKIGKKVVVEEGENRLIITLNDK